MIPYQVWANLSLDSPQHVAHISKNHALARGTQPSLAGLLASWRALVAFKKCAEEALQNAYYSLGCFSRFMGRQRSLLGSEQYSSILEACFQRAPVERRNPHSTDDIMILSG